VHQVDDHLGELRQELEGFDTDHEKKFIEVRNNLELLENICHVILEFLLRKKWIVRSCCWASLLRCYPSNLALAQALLRA
jgi:hypothetical protein